MPAMLGANRRVAPLLQQLHAETSPGRVELRASVDRSGGFRSNGGPARTTPECPPPSLKTATAAIQGLPGIWGLSGFQRFCSAHGCGREQ